MEYEVEREHAQWHVREKGQTTRGTTVTDAWLAQMGFGTLTRLNIDSVVKATMAAAGGQALDPYAARRMPKDMNFTPSSRSYPKPRIPERMLFRAKS